MRTYITLLVGALAAALPAPAAAQNFTSTRTDCSGLELYGAKGVPSGSKHGYQFRGICRELEMDDDKTVLGVRWQGWVEVETVYDTKTATLMEGVTVKISGPSSGPPSGDIQLVLKCAQDPMLTSSKCTVMQSAATTPWPDFVQAWKSGKPFTQGKVTLALGADSAVLRTFPAGSRVLRNESEILVDWGGGTYNAGPERPARRLTLPRRGDP